jgi:hypothetical protein
VRIKGRKWNPVKERNICEKNMENVGKDRKFPPPGGAVENLEQGQSP